MSKPRESLLTSPNRATPLSIVWEHFLHEDRFDFAYSTTTFEEEGEGGISDEEEEMKWGVYKRGEKGLGFLKASWMEVMGNRRAEMESM